MKRSKVFMGLAILFVLLMALAVYDFSRKTVFPGSKRPLNDSIEKLDIKLDSNQSSSKK